MYPCPQKHSTGVSMYFAYALNALWNFASNSIMISIEQLPLGKRVSRLGRP